MLKPPQRPGPTPPAGALAPHVQAAVGRTVQARMPERAALPVRQPAPHVQAAVGHTVQARMPERAVLPGRQPAPHVQAVVGRVAQAKPAVAPPPGRVIPPPPVHSPRSGPPVVQKTPVGTIQKNGDGPVYGPVLPATITGMNRDNETVKTAGGTWKALRYVAVRRLNDNWAWGASMTLEFTPESPADATKIALVQTVLGFKNGSFYHLDDPTTTSRSFAGASIDQVPESRSPLYADDPETGNGTLGSSAEEPLTGQHGYRYWSSQQNQWMVKAARLRDTPHFRNVTSFSSQTFETTALAVEGNDKGAYYGSVRWGWRRKDDGDVVLDPLTLESYGSASDAFVVSAQQWNKTKTSGGQTPQQLPPVAPRQVIPVKPIPPRLNPGTPFSSITNDQL